MANNYINLFVARVRNSSNVLLCTAPSGVMIASGDRVIVSSKADDVGFQTEVECFAVTDSGYVDGKTIEILLALCNEQFPLRSVKGRYHIERFEAEEVADAE